MGGTAIGVHLVGITLVRAWPEAREVEVGSTTGRMCSAGGRSGGTSSRLAASLEFVCIFGHDGVGGTES